jgi:ribonucleoside-diphosphate reductase subunit M2
VQAASAIDSLKMESPVKKLDFSVEDKENKPFDSDVAVLAEKIDATAPVKPVVEAVEPVQKPAVAPGIKEAEADEPLLQENPQRFVLFPIKYHEVSDASCTGPATRQNS